MILEAIIDCEEIKQTEPHKGHFLHWCCTFGGIMFAVVTAIPVYNSNSIDPYLKIPLMAFLMLSASTAGEGQLPDVANVDIYDNSTTGQVSSDIDEV